VSASLSHNQFMVLQWSRSVRHSIEMEIAGFLPREPWGISSDDQSVGPSTRRPPVQIRYVPPRPHSSAAEHQDDSLERHVRLVLRVLRSCGEKDITLDYESRGWGFKSLRERTGSASSMGEHLVYTQGTGVRFLR
jgi:hypothetical protein